jgi:uncharacterized delta-60 repeat protein
VKQLGIFRFRDRVSVISALGLSLWSCGEDDATLVAQDSRELEPESSVAVLLPGGPTTPAGQGSGTGSSESGPGNAALNPATGTPADPVVAPAVPSGPIEYWSDGATVNGVSADVDDRFHGVTLDAEDNVYAVGYLGAGLGDDRVIVVAKYDHDAEPVLDFGTAGRVEVNVSTYLGTPVSDTLATADVSGEEGRDIALQSDGKIVVVGRAETPTDLAPTSATPIDIVVFRLAATGARDTSFGTLGLTVLNPGNGPNDLAWGVDIDASNRIYVFGHGLATNPVDAAAPRTDQDRYVWRLNPDGSLDSTFANQGMFTFDLPNGATTLAVNDNSRRGYVLPDGKIISSGYSNVGGRNQIVLTKLLDTGAPDTSFSSDGIVRLAPFPIGFAECYGVGFQSDGSFITTGYGNVDSERAGGAELLDMVSFRVRPDGTPDPSWGVAGAVVFNPGDAQDRGRAVVALADDRVLYAGAVTEIGTNKDALLLLLEKNGAPTLNFDASGHKAYDFGGDNEEFFSLKVSPSGKYLAAAGYATGTGLANGNGVLAVVPLGK